MQMIRNNRLSRNVSQGHQAEKFTCTGKKEEITGRQRQGKSDFSLPSNLVSFYNMKGTRCLLQQPLGYAAASKQPLQTGNSAISHPQMRYPVFSRCFADRRNDVLIGLQYVKLSSSDGFPRESNGRMALGFVKAFNYGCCF